VLSTSLCRCRVASGDPWRPGAISDAARVPGSGWVTLAGVQQGVPRPPRATRKDAFRYQEGNGGCGGWI
jgi:hypothetical protein